MDRILSFPLVRLVIGVSALCLLAGPAAALDPALAKICREKAIEAHPTKPAGSSSGHAKAQRDYYNKCIANEGKMDPEPEPDAAKKADTPPSTPAP